MTDVADGLVEEAVRYARLGYRVFPCRPGTKKPHTTNGFHDATRDEGLIRGWWNEWPHALLATPDTCTVDIETKPDGADGWATWRKLVKEHGEPLAPFVQTGNYPLGRGGHLHFAYRADLKAGTFAEGIELRAAGSYVLLPPSPHPTGVHYEGELPPLDELPALPEWIAELRRRRKRDRKPSHARVAAGERHERWVEEAGRLRKQGLPVKEARRALRDLREREFLNPAEKTDEELDAILQAYQEWDGAQFQDEITWLSDHDLKEVEWVERPLLQLAFTLLAGRPGVGKGALVARWVARCTNGEMYGEPRPAILLSSEDDPEVDLGPRVEAAGGNRDLVALPPTTFQLPRDIEWLRGYVQSINRQGRGNVGLIAIDPMANHTGTANTDKEAEVRVALMPLAVLVNEIHIPTIGVRHLSTKEARGGALAKILGSTAWIGVPRVVLAAVTDSQDHEIVHVHPIKGNRVPRGDSGRRYRLEGRTLPGFTESVVSAVEDGASDVDVDAELAGHKPTESASAQAREIILLTLQESGGSMESDRLDAVVAAEAGVSAKTVQNLRGELRTEGLIRSVVAERHESGFGVKRWRVELTNAIGPSRAGVRISRDLCISTHLSPIDPDSPSSRATGSKDSSAAFEAALAEIFDADGNPKL